MKICGGGRLENKLAFPSGAKDAVPLDSDCTASAVHTLATYYFCGMDQHRGREVIGCNMVLRAT